MGDWFVLYAERKNNDRQGEDIVAEYDTAHKRTIDL